MGFPLTILGVNSNADLNYEVKLKADCTLRERERERSVVGEDVCKRRPHVST